MTPLYYYEINKRMVATQDDHLQHHGILGMKWGKKNGPPYPLASGDHSSSEKKAGWRKSLGGGRNEKLYDRKRKTLVSVQKVETSGIKRTLKDKEKEEQKKIGNANKKKLLMIGAAAVGTGLAVYGGYKLSKYVKLRNEDTKKAADIIKKVADAKIFADTSNAPPALSRKINVGGLDIKPTNGSNKMSDIKFIREQLKKSGTYSKEYDFWTNAENLYSRKDFDKVKKRAKVLTLKNVKADNKAYKKAIEAENKAWRDYEKQKNKFYEKELKKRLK